MFILHIRIAKIQTFCLKYSICYTEVVKPCQTYRI